MPKDTIADFFDPLPEDDAPDDGDDRRSDAPTPLDAVVDAALDATLGPGPGPIRPGAAVAVRVPGASWCQPTVRRLRARIRGASVMAFTGARYGEGNEADLLDRLARGRPVVGVASELRHIPRSLPRTADATLELRAPVGLPVAVAIASATGRSCPTPADDLGAGLDLHELAVAIRPGDDPASAMARIARAQATAGGLEDLRDAPPLDTLAGYGPAMSWSRDLLDDVAE